MIYLNPNFNGSTTSYLMAPHYMTCRQIFHHITISRRSNFTSNLSACHFAMSVNNYHINAPLKLEVKYSRARGGGGGGAVYSSSFRIIEKSNREKHS